jgi:mRNA-degrading endonuclease RelE of RelBE toxin-antitoxin system
MSAMLSTKESLQFPYKCNKTDEFEKAFRKLDTPVQKTIQKTIEEVLFRQPYASKKLISAEHKGKRSLRKGDYRILFAVCEECVKLREVDINRCKSCQSHGTNDVMIFTVGHRKKIYDA